MLDDFVTFGRSGLRVSRYALGAFNFGGTARWSVEPAVASAMIARYRELGGNFIDAANVYGGGEAEVIIGDYLAATPDSREQLVIASKFGGNTLPGDPNAGGGGRKAIVQACEASLRRLKTDRIDLYWMHLWDCLTPIEETLRALDDLTRAGKILHIGLSNFPAWKTSEAVMLAQFRDYAPIAGLQLQYSLLERSIETELVPMAESFGLGIAAWSPLKSGALSGRYRRETLAAREGEGRSSFVARALDERGLAILDAVIRIAERRGIPPAHVALGWLHARPCVQMILMGPSSLAQLEENAAAARVVLDLEDIATLEEISRPPLPYPADFARRSHSSVSGGATINGVAGNADAGAPGSRAR
jgi:aryl-alcohol dehydrogenase-like predicted oxidoreductase